MSTPYEAAGVNFDALFQPLGGDTPGPNCGYKIAGVDLAQRYKASTSSADWHPDPLPYKVGGVNLREFFKSLAAVAPVFTTHPTGGAILEGDSLTLTVAVAVATGVTYQWKKNGVDISGQTTTSLFFAAINRTDDASYTCVATNVHGSTTSSAAVVDVQFAPSISSHPSTIGRLDTETATFTVGVSAGDPSSTSYQWQINTGGGWSNITGGKYSGYTTNTLTFTCDTSDDTHQFRCVVSNTIGSATSNAATLAVDAILAPVVTSDPSPITADAGSGPHALVCGIYPGDGTNYFSWYKNGVLIAGPRVGNISASEDQHVFPTLTTADAGSYQCRISTSYGATDNSAHVDVTVNVAHPSITTHPSDITDTEGSGPHALICETDAGVGYGAKTFSWYKDGVFQFSSAGNLSGGHGHQHVFNPLEAGDAGVWFCRVTTPYGGQTDSNSATVTVL